MPGKKGSNRNSVTVGSFRGLPQKARAETILALPRNRAKKLLENLNDKEIIGFLKFLDLDEAAYLLRGVGTERAARITSELEKEDREKIELLLRFAKETAAGVMSLDYVQVDVNERVSGAIKAAEKHEKKTGKFPSVLVTKNNSLVGEIPVHNLMRLPTKEPVSGHYSKIPSVYYNHDAEKLSQILEGHPHDKIVVIDMDESILGVIYAHGILKAINETGSLAKFAGVKKEEGVFDSYTQKTGSRYRWLILNLGTAFLAASVVGLFEETIAKFVLLAAYMPIVAGMGGNAGTQTLAVFVRGIALNEIEFNRKAISAILGEVMAGALNGLITGALAAAIAVFWNQSPMLGVIIGLAMVINLVIAGFFGAVIPLTMKKLGKDPATSATIFITTATDVFGFFAFLGLATLLL